MRDIIYKLLRGYRTEVGYEQSVRRDVVVLVNQAIQSPNGCVRSMRSKYP